MQPAMQRPKLVTPPAQPVVTLDEAKAHCYVEHGEHDALITSLVAAATSHLDGWSGILGRCLVNQQWSVAFGGFPYDRYLRLPFPDVDPDSVTVSYFDSDNQEQVLPADRWHLAEMASGSRLMLAQMWFWPSVCDQPDAVTVTFTAGYGALGSDVPDAIRHAILLLVGHFYENREAVTVGVTATDLPLGVDRLISGYRRVSI
ncbi:head-tail connector protein [Roseibium sp. RKSG952]|uniref:head-tail connector protein n=1 Tax=Roseibium sp. RKSG952 TaxID=2529384 RepID=UPI0012BB4A67|nr:head-tail connector protein [Roseibium sp. RKSG952]MTH96648.1 hypothetical protein [Roseibium sp. RKSG952]